MEDILGRKLAWLAGFWDGEGSVGFLQDKTTSILVAQLSHTDRDTVVAVLSTLRESQVSGRGYTYQERDPRKHRDAHYIRVTGVVNVLTLGRLLLPYSVTKRRHWELAALWADNRIRVAGGIDSSGHLRRGGIASNRKYSEEDMRIVEEMRELNRRGPENRQSLVRGRIAI